MLHVNVTSIGGVRPTHDILPYAAAKAALNALTLGFADALGPKVRVNAVMPGPFRTDISKHWDHEAFAERARGRNSAAGPADCGAARMELSPSVGLCAKRDQHVEMVSGARNCGNVSLLYFKAAPHGSEHMQ